MNANSEALLDALDILVFVGASAQGCRLAELSSALFVFVLSIQPKTHQSLISRYNLNINKIKIIYCLLRTAL